MPKPELEPGAAPYYSYGVKVKLVTDPDLWSWQVDGEPGNGVLGFGFGRTRPQAVRRAARCVRSHGRRRGNKRDYWWVDTQPADEAEGPLKSIPSHKSPPEDGYVYIEIDRLPYRRVWGTFSGSEIRRFAAPPIGDDRDLWLVVPGGNDRKIEDTDKVEMRTSGLRFWTAPKIINPGAPKVKFDAT